VSMTECELEDDQGHKGELSVGLRLME